MKVKAFERLLEALSALPTQPILFRVTHICHRKTVQLSGVNVFSVSVGNNYGDVGNYTIWSAD